ncbi:IS1 family transposase [Paenibacillus thalictri]|nr:IS1 family transposase [Paenibacillus thalictri]
MQETGKMVCSYVRFGLVNGTHWQRYRCRQCKRVFSDLTRTLFHRSRNIQKWPLFIQYVMVEKLPAKQIAAKLELHINTIYTWNKKLSAFFALYLPNKQFQQSDQSSHDSATITVSLTDKGNTLRQKSQFPESSDDAESNSTVTIPVTIAVNRENPSHILFTIHQDTGSNVALKAAPSQTEALTKVIQEFRAYNSKKRGIAFRNLFMHLTFFRMLKLMEAINPVIMPYELFKLCLDKDRLSRSNRLLKRLI